jgi:predicted flavoprotein YhiN
VYALSAPIRDAIAANGEATLAIDLRPDLAAEALAARLRARRGKQSLSSFLRAATRLSPVAVALLHEATLATGSTLGTLSPDDLAHLIKAVPVRLTGVAPLVRAISTAGGVSLDEVEQDFMLRRRPGVFAAGEMLDWEAPTGGYLLQACLATGAAAARGALMRLAARGAAA